MANATDKQIDYIIRLANQLTGRADRYLSQVEDVLPMRTRRGLTSSDASTCIDHLQRALNGQPDTEPEPEVTVEPVAFGETATATDVIAMVGKKVEIASTKSGKTYTGRVSHISLDDKTNSKVVLNLNILTPGPQIPQIAIENIGAWKILP